jgi:hypothetical protein
MLGEDRLEQELFSINAVAPGVLEHLPRLFEEAVTESLTRILGARDASGILASLNRAGLGNRSEVFGLLDAICSHQASPLQKAVDRAFRTRVHNLAMQVM